jgi:hypothetical protein
MLTRRRREWGAALVLAVSFGVAAAGCGGEKTANVARPGLDPGSFSAGSQTANPWFPLEPGTQWVREGRVNRGHRRLRHRVVTTVTDVVKDVGGVRATVVLDQDFDGGEIAEQAIDYVAVDRHRNVWDLGSYTETYEGGQFVNAADARLAGVKGAQAGILVQGRPRPETPPYSEGKVPGEAQDIAKVVKSGQSQCVPFKCYRDVLVIGEGSADESDLSEYKYFAPGVGQIRTEPRTGHEQEVEVLVNLTQLSPRALAELSAEALRLDRHARVEAKDVFGGAPPARRVRDRRA